MLAEQVVATGSRVYGIPNEFSDFDYLLFNPDLEQLYELGFDIGGSLQPETNDQFKLMFALAMNRTG